MLSTKLYVEGEDLALSPTIRSLPGMDVGVVSDAGTDPEHNAFFFWVEAPDFEAVDEALAADHTVESFTVVAEDDDRRTYRVEYSDRAKLVTPGIVDVDGLTLSASNRSEGWLLHLELPDHDALLELTEYVRDRGFRVDIVQIQHKEGTDHDHGTSFGLTEPQREALVAAFVQGYYDDPRETSQEELAAMLGISSSAVSGRLRRGAARLVEEFLVEEE